MRRERARYMNYDQGLNPSENNGATDTMKITTWAIMLSISDDNDQQNNLQCNLGASQSRLS
jgi:hypothetical protein